MTKSSRVLTYLFAAMFVLVLIAKGLAVWTDYLWFGVMGQTPVFTTILWTRATLGLLFGIPMALWLWANFRVARKPLPEDVTLIGKRLLPEEERAQVEAYADKALIAIALLGGLLTGLIASGKWLAYLQMTHAVPFGDVDPLFGQDVGFYVFKLTFLRYLWRTIFYGIIVAILLSALVHLYMEAIRIVGNTIQTLPRSRGHIYVLAALALIVKVWGYRLDQFALLLGSRGGVFSGAAYADVNGRAPVLYGLMALCVVAAVVVLINIRSRRLFWPVGAVASVFVVSFLGGTTYPALVQKLVVLPTQLDKEKPYIEHNITATTKAYGLDKIRNETHQVSEALTWDDVQANRDTVDNIRLWDHRPLEKTLDQVQALRAYYDFPDVDNDRYMVNGRYRQVMLAPRQIDANKIPPPQTWVKDRLQYTHGYGVAAVPVNEIQKGESDEGLPNYWVKNIPPVSVPGLEIDPKRAGVYINASIHPRLIEIIQQITPQERLGDKPQQPQQDGGQGQGQGQGQGEGGPEPPGARMQKIMDEPLAQIEPYVLVNTAVQELDYPRIGAAGEGNAYTRYTGKSGVPVGSFLRRVAFAARLHDLQFLLTQSITSDSKVMINRTLPERIQALCPYFLICDPDPYITIIDKKLVWINDAYTYSRAYPYSTPHRAVQVNYLRNSVKVVVDAYDGIPEFYAVDQSDPMLKCYMSIFPSLFKTEKAPVEVQKHFRYPQLQFVVQSEMYADYHMTEPESFYQREDSWAIATELYGSEPRVTEAYHTIMRLPGEKKEEFLLMVPMTLKGREDRNMVAWTAARCDPEHYGELICYKFPSGVQVDGPMQVESLIGQNKEFSEKQTLWSQHGSTIIRGNLLVIPIAKSLLYVEPIYIAASKSAIPELKLVALVNNKRVALGNDLNDALRKLFGSRAGQVETAPSGSVTSAPPVAGLSGTMVELIDQALKLEASSKKALADGDLGEYQKLQREQAGLLEKIKDKAK